MRIRIIALLFFCSPFALAESLPKLNIDPNQVTVSGLSSGAFMANQLLVAYSGTIRGAALFAGGPYFCSKGSLATALSVCMNNPAMSDLGALTALTNEMATKGKIDPLKNLSNARLFIFSSSADSVVKGDSGKQVQKQMSQWVNASNIQLVESPSAEHGIPTLNFGNVCGSLGAPYLQNCQFDGIGAALQHLYHNQLKPAREPTPEEHKKLVRFEQSKFADFGANLLPEGLVFIPATCQSGGACRLHIALHGCQQSTNFVGDVFAEKAGYLSWAVANNIVVIFPQVESSAQNPKGCWDWFAYTGSQFATKEGPQMKSIRAMIQQVSGF